MKKSIPDFIKNISVVDDVQAAMLKSCIVLPGYRSIHFILFQFKIFEPGI